ncbi:MAG: hypothetical protein WDW38_009174 [Sanguina aurantia]
MDLSTVANSWVESYLEALVCAKYYVNQILALNEEGIRSAWQKSSACSGRSQDSRDARVEYVSWRVWAMKRRRAAVARDAAAALREDEETKAEWYDMTALALRELAGASTSRIWIPRPPPPALGRIQHLRLLPALRPFAQGPDHPIRPLPRRTASNTASHNASACSSATAAVAAGLSGPFAASSGPLFSALLAPTQASGGDEVLSASRHPRLYIVLISLHGLVRGENMELGKDPDTGGQVKYVVELAKALARIPSVSRVDLLTRMISDPKVDPSYSQPEERLRLDGPPPTPSSGATPRASTSFSAAAAATAAAAAAAAFAEPLRNHTVGLLDAAVSILGGGRGRGEGGEASGCWEGELEFVEPTGAFIVRLPAGPSEVYLRKEDLWPHVREFADRAISHIAATLTRLHDIGEGSELYAVHGHYADAGEAAALIAATLGCDMALTGHSLGRNKKAHLLQSGTCGRAEMESAYRISRRIEGEERALDAASAVFASTAQEVREQWGLYDGYPEQLSAVLAVRPCTGYHVPRMTVIPPGLDFSNLKVDLPQDPFAVGTAPSSNENSVRGSGSNVQIAAGPLGRGCSPSPSNHTTAGNTPKGGLNASARWSSGGRELEAFAAGSSDFSDSAARARHHRLPSPPQQPPPAPFPDPPIWKEVAKFLRNPRKPVILAMSRPDSKKNVAALLHAYGSSNVLRELANLVLILGNRDAIDSMAPGSARVMEGVLKLIDAYNLYGCVAYPKRHSQTDISDIYLLAAATKGVFVNPALQEPFGLTLIEAAAHGVPIVATTHGGPVDIVATLKNGLLIEPTDPSSISSALITIITDRDLWDTYSANGRNLILAYCWPSHCLAYLKTLEEQRHRQRGISWGGAWGRQAGEVAGGAGGMNGPGGLARKRGMPSLGSLSRLSMNFSELESLNRTIEEILPSHPDTPMDISRQASGHTTPHMSAGLGSMGAFPNSIITDPPTPPTPLSPSHTRGRTGNLLALNLDHGFGSQIQASDVPQTPDPDLPMDESFSRHHSIDEVSFERLLRGGRGVGNNSDPARLAASRSRAAAVRSRQRFVVIAVECAEDVKRAVELMQAYRSGGGPDAQGIAGGVGQTYSESVGFGLLAVGNVTETRGSLLAAGGTVSDLDWLVCGAGAQVWHTTACAKDGETRESALSQSKSPSAALLCDEDYERHIDFRWDHDVVKQVMRRIVKHKQGWGGLPLAGAAGAPRPLMSLQGLPFQVTLTMALKTPATLVGATGSSTASSGGKLGILDGSQLVERMRGKLRRCGVRAQLLLSSTISAAAASMDPRSQLRQPSSVAAAGSGSGARASPDLTPSGPESDAVPAPSGLDLATASSGICPTSGTSTLMSSPSGCGVAWKTAVHSTLNGHSNASTTTVLSLHVTPMRCSRSLSLRYLAQHYKVPLSDFTLVAFTAQQPVGSGTVGEDTEGGGGSAAAVRSSTLSGPMARQKSVGLGGGLGGVQAAGAGGSGRAKTAMLCSDGEELVGGIQRVVLLGRGHVAVAAGACRFSVDLSPYDPARVSLGGDVEAS